MDRIRKQSSLALEIGARLRSVREQNGWQQKEFAERIGLLGPQLSRYEAGSDLPNIYTLAAICELLEVSLDEMVCGKKSGERVRVVDLELRDRLKSLEEVDQNYRKTVISVIDGILAQARHESEDEGKRKPGR
jgi:transcriptional regulator with XRE-family HTH domain